MKMYRLALVLIALAALTLSQTVAIQSVSADDYTDVKNKHAKDLRSKKGSERAAAITAICRTGDVRAAKLAIQTMLKEKDPMAAMRMGHALEHFSGAEALEAIEGRVEKMTGINKAFPALWAMIGLAKGKTEIGDAFIKKMILETKEKKVYIKTAALEAIAVARRNDFPEPIIATLKNHNKDWEKNPIAIITACTCAARLFDPNTAFDYVNGLADVIEKYENERVRTYAASACGSIASSKPFLDPVWWRYWAKHKGEVGAGTGNNAKKPGSTSVRKKQPEFFGVEAVGNRIVFIIDNSGSMASDVTPPPQPKKEKPKKKKGPITGKSGKGKKGKKEPEEIPPPDYSKVKTKLDLAKVELIYTLNQLDKDYEFNVVVYSTDHRYLISSTKGFVKADKGNKKRFINAIKKLNTEGATNIHGALMRGFRTNKSKPIKGDPSLAKEGFQSGAETIFFLTDGSACYCDGSTAQGPDGMGNGPFASGPKLFPDIVRVNTFRKVVINAIGIGPHDRGLMSALARSSGGIYRDLSGQ